MRKVLESAGICLAAVLWLISCGKMEPEAPARTTQRTEIQNRISDIKLPLIYKVADLEDLINEKIKGTLYQDNSFENNNGDNLKIRIAKSSKIYVAVQGNSVFYNFPLTVKAEYKKGFLPAISTDFALRVKFISRLSLDENWKLISRTEFIDLVWTKKPRLNLAVASVGITGIVEDALRGRMDDLVKLIDKHAPERLDIKKEVTKVWTSIQKPILINSRGQKVWLKIDPQTISAGSLNGRERNISIKLGIHAYLSLLSGENPEFEIVEELPPLKEKTDESDEFNIFVLARAPYRELNDVLDRTLKDREFEIKGRRVRIKDARVYGSGDYLVLKADVGGAAKGTVYFRGTPEYDGSSSAFRVKNFDFDVNSRAVLVKTADWLLHGNVQEKIQEKLSFPIESQIDKLPGLIHEAIEGGKLGRKITLTFEDLDVRPESILIAAEDIQILAAARGTAVMHLEEIVK